MSEIAALILSFGLIFIIINYISYIVIVLVAAYLSPLAPARPYYAALRPVLFFLFPAVQAVVDQLQEDVPVAGVEITDSRDCRTGLFSVLFTEPADLFAYT